VRWLVYIIVAAAMLSSCLKQPENYPPVIESIILNPAENFIPGSEIGVAASVTDRDGDALEFHWASNGGSIGEPDLPSTTWELPVSVKPESYVSITLTVTDGKGASTRSKTIQVSEGLQIEGYTYFNGTTIPIPGVEVDIGKFSTVSDEQGHYSISYLNEGNTVITAYKEGFEYYDTVVYVDNPRSIFHILMTSPTLSRHISGNIRTVDNISFEGLKVSLLNPDGSESKLFDFTDPSGNYDIADVPVGTRYLMISNQAPESHFLNDSLIYRIDLDGTVNAFNARIKIRRTVLSDQFLSQAEKWEFGGSTAEGFYLVGKGQKMILKQFLPIPEDAEKAMFSLNSYVIGGCDMVGDVPSHRVWIVNREEEYMGGITWGGDGNNYPAVIEWYPSEPPNFMDIYGRDIKLMLEVSGNNTCVPNPFWRIYQIEFNYYY
jgi:hypothetical protein